MCDHWELLFRKDSRVRNIHNYDVLQAAKCYRAASDQGNASATYNLAVFYAHGYGGLKPDRDKAIQLLESAVALGEPNAKRLLDKYNVVAQKKTEPTTTSEKKNENAIDIAEVQTRFAALRLPLTRTNRVTEDDVKCNSSKSNSISTDDGLASEYESSNSSGVSYSGMSQVLRKLFFNLVVSFRPLTLM